MSECVTDAIVCKRKPIKGLYVIGPVTGIAKDNRPAFEAARKRLHDAGYMPVGIPHDSIEPGTSWNQAMRMSLCNMLMYMDRFDEKADDLVFDSFEYDGIALLDGWHGSKGARIERSVAMAVGMPCRTVDKWCSLAEDAHHDES